MCHGMVVPNDGGLGGLGGLAPSQGPTYNVAQRIVGAAARSGGAWAGITVASCVSAWARFPNVPYNTPSRGRQSAPQDRGSTMRVRQTVMREPHQVEETPKKTRAIQGFAECFRGS
jgi:hypothetical protein